MALSKTETVLSALVNQLNVALGAGFVVRNDVETGSIPSSGKIDLRDGDAETPEMLGTAWGHTRTCELVLQVSNGDPSARDIALDALIGTVVAIIEGDPSLGGEVDSAVVLPPSVDSEYVEGDASIKSAVLPVVLDFISSARWG